jgi:ATP-dependent Clp protease ATP-binding subunit ClpA
MMGLGFWNTEEARAVLDSARKAAVSDHSSRTEIVHLFRALLSSPSPHADVVLRRAGIDRRELENLFLSPTSSSEEVAPSDLSYSPEAKAVLESTMHLAAARNEGYIGTGHLIVGLLNSDHPLLASLSATLPAKDARIDWLGKEIGELAGEHLPPEAPIVPRGPPVIGHLTSEVPISFLRNQARDDCEPSA